MTNQPSPRKKDDEFIFVNDEIERIWPLINKIRENYRTKEQNLRVIAASRTWPQVKVSKMNEIQNLWLKIKTRKQIQSLLKIEDFEEVQFN